MLTVYIGGVSFCTTNLLLIPDASIVSTSVFILFSKCGGVLQAACMYPGLLVQGTRANRDSSFSIIYCKPFYMLLTAQFMIWHVLSA